MSRRNRALREARPTAEPPKRYDEMFAGEASASPASSVPVQGATVESAAPASVLSGRAQLETFRRAGDDPKDPDRGRKGNVRPDGICLALESNVYRDDARMDWCCGIDGYKLRFSRRYPHLNLLVDVFAGDSQAVRKEVARKRSQIEEHNIQARPLYEEASEDTQRFMRERALAPMGYIPLFAGKFGTYDVDWDAAKRGEVLDLPAPVVHPQWEPAGIGVQAIGAR